MPKVRIPTPLRSYTQNKDEVSVSGATVREVLASLEQSYPGIGARLLDEKGALRRYVNIFHNDEDIRGDLQRDLSDATKRIRDMVGRASAGTPPHHEPAPLGVCGYCEGTGRCGRCGGRGSAAGCDRCTTGNCSVCYGSGRV